MKKIFSLAACLVAFSFVSCNKSAETTEATDTTAVVTETVEVPQVDSAAMTCDSAKTACDSACKAECKK